MSILNRLLGSALDLNKEHPKGQPYRHSFKSLLIKLLLNLLLLVFIIIALTSRLVDFLLIMPLGFLLKKIGLMKNSYSSNPITSYFRKLAHFVLIPASQVLTNENKIANKLIPSRNQQHGYQGDSKLFVTLSGNGGHIAESEAMTLANKFYGTTDGISLLLLSHSDPQCSLAATVSELVNSYVDQISKALSMKSTINEISLYGASIGGAILVKALAIINRLSFEMPFGQANNSPFGRLTSCNMIADRTLESLTKVTNCSDSRCGLFPALSLAWVILGWQIQPKQAIKEICSRGSKLPVNIYINTARHDDILGSGKLSSADLMCSGNVTIYARRTHCDHNGYDDHALVKNSYNKGATQKTCKELSPLLS